MESGLDLKKLIKEKGVKQGWLAHVTGINPATISKYVTKTISPSYENVNLLLNAMGYEIVIVDKVKGELNE